MAVPGLSSLGITFGYGVETVAGEKPTKFTQLTRINELGDAAAEPEAIDASALEDFYTRNISGRTTVSDTYTVTVNLTPDTLAEWEKVLEEYKKLEGTCKSMWFETITPGFTKAEFIKAQPPSVLPVASKGQNELLTVEINLILEDLVGFDTKVDFTPGE
jgi:hypothetical protein